MIIENCPGLHCESMIIVELSRITLWKHDSRIALEAHSIPKLNLGTQRAYNHFFGYFEITFFLDIANKW